MMALDVRRSHLSGQSASVLDSMTSLYSLNIAYSHIKPADLSPACIGRLIFFSMDASQLDDAGVDAMKAVHGKAGTPFHDFVLYDADKASLEKLLQLNLTFSLRLGGEPVSADCVPLLVQLAKQNNLKHLSIDDSRLTRDSRFHSISMTAWTNARCLSLRRDFGDASAHTVTARLRDRGCRECGLRQSCLKQATNSRETDGK